MNKPQFIRSNAPHVVEVAEGSHDARSNFGGERGPDGRWTEIDTSEFVHDEPPSELKTVSFDRSGTISGTAPEGWDLRAPPAVPAPAALGAYVMEPNPGSDQAESHFSERISQPNVEVAEGGHAARSNFARLVTDVRRTEIDASEFVHAEPPPELNPVPFDRSSTLPGSAPQVLDLLDVSPNPQPNTSAPPALPAAAALGAQVKKPSNPSGDQAQSHLAARIGELKAANNQVRAALKRIESAPPKA
jgi:hypothetical protein